jgi:type I restriction-modification system DNA methylase subunit
LDGAQLTNADLLAAMKSMRWASQSGGSLAPIDYRNMGTEELGSVYESLLELVPEVDLHARTFGFVGLTSVGSTAGNDRKLTGSFYTPDSLVQELVKSALDPVIEQRLAANPGNPIEALLSIRVLDPACGSGHFLLAAARRLAERWRPCARPTAWSPRRPTATLCARS